MSELFLLLSLVFNNRKGKDKYLLTPEPQKHFHFLISSGCSAMSLVLKSSGTAHHKHPTRSGPRVAVLHRATVGLVVIGLPAVVEGVVVQGVHQVGINFTEEHADLCVGDKTEETQSALTTAILALNTVWMQRSTKTFNYIV